jgi:glycosyltransferase involved in cell wall biosynthesis
MQNGWQSFIAFGRGRHTGNSRKFRIGSDAGLYANALLARLFDNEGFAAKHGTLQLIRHLESIKPDIIHLHNLHGYYLNIRLLFEYIAQTDIPVVWTLHDCWPFTGHCTYFDHIRCDRWKTGCFSCPQKKEYPASFCRDNSEQNYLGKKQTFSSLKNIQLVTPSIWLAELVKYSFLAKYPVRVISNGINLQVFRPVPTHAVREKHQLGGKKIILGVAGIWNERKGLKYFIELEKLISGNEQIVIIGLTKKQIRQLPIGILGLGRTESTGELAAWYSAADVFLNPSSEETFGLTTAEALACGTPVIVLDATASPELVSPETGLIFPKDDHLKLFDAVKEILNKGKESYTAACVARAQRLYDSTERYQDYLSVYRQWDRG